MKESGIKRADGAGTGGKVEEMVRRELAGPGAVRAALKQYLYAGKG